MGVFLKKKNTQNVKGTGSQKVTVAQGAPIGLKPSVVILKYMNCIIVVSETAENPNKI